VKLDFADFQFLSKVRKIDSTIEILPFVCQHDFSHAERDIQKVEFRFRLYIQDCFASKKENIIDRFGYFFVSITHLIKLTMMFRSIKFTKIYFKTVWKKLIK